MTLDIAAIAGRVQRLRTAASGRDARMNTMRAVRRGDMASVYPEMFPEDMDKAVVANFVDYAARDLAEMIAPLPSLHCATGLTTTQKQRAFAARKTNVGHSYWLHSKLKQSMTSAADRYLSYGFLPLVVEPDFDAKTPRIRLEDPYGSYPQFDRDGVCVAFAKAWRQSVDDLCAMWPEHAPTLRSKTSQSNGGLGSASSVTEMEVVRFSDSDCMVLYLPDYDNFVLASTKNPLGRCPVVVARRPGLDEELRGQFDDVIPVQMARAQMGMLALEAANKVVQAPLALPDDVNQLPYGPDAIIRSRSPEKIRRVGLEISPAVFGEIQNLEAEMRKGGRYPEGRTGTMDASVITGRGVQELLGTIDTQIKTAQTALGEALRQATSMCFEMDEKLWPNARKTVSGVIAGLPFEETYTASRDIAGDYGCDVTYGFAAGLGPNQALVFLLQLRGDKLIPRDFVLQNLAMDMDVTSVQRAVEVEEVRDALRQGLSAYVQSIGLLAQQGMDPSEPLRKAAEIVAGMQKGKTIEDLMAAAFQPPPPAAGGPQTDPATGQPTGGGDTPPGMEASGLPFGVAPGQAGMSPGGRPDVQNLVAGLMGNRVKLGADVSRRLPV